MGNLVNQYGCFADFCHYLQSAMSPHTHAYHYCLFESGTKRVCEQSLYIEKYRTTIYVNTKSYSKVGFSYNNN